MYTQEQLLHIFEYKDGQLYWKNPIAKNVKVGSLAGHINKKSYCKIIIDGKSFFAHRLIFTMHTGLSPEMVDHIDRNPLNNNIDNLRAATRSQNVVNSVLRKDSSSGVKGVSWHKRQKKWNVRIQVGKTRMHVGSFDDFELAELVSAMAREKYHGDFACHGNTQ